MIEKSKALEISPELSGLLEAIYDEIFITDGDGVVLKVNASCERLYSLKESDLIGRNVANLQARGIFTPSATLAVLKRREKVSILQETNTGLRLFVTSIPVYDQEGKITRVISVSRDVTEISALRRQLEESQQLIEWYKRELNSSHPGKTPPGYARLTSRPMVEILSLLERLANVDSTVLLLGESGVGKGVLARLLHEKSPRHAGPFAEINLGAIPESLMESELFGYVRGAFTGANREGKPGLLELAHDGTLFLDEIAELPWHLQAKLLQFLQDYRITRIGASQSLRLNVRVVAATNRNLEEMVARGEFREDLYYRLNVVPLTIPPLRQHPEDIPFLVDYFLERFARRYSLNRGLTPAAMAALQAYPWPGNIRELENIVERLVVTSPTPLVDVNDLPEKVLRTVRGRLSPVPTAERPLPGETPLPASARASREIDGEEPVTLRRLVPWKTAIASLERQLLVASRRHCSTTYEMAQVLEINQSTVVRKLHHYFKKTADQP